MPTANNLWRRTFVAVVSVALSVAALDVAPASATLTEEATDVVKSVAAPITVPSAPSLPSADPPSIPIPAPPPPAPPPPAPPPVAAPAAPESPAPALAAVPRAASEAVSRTAPPPSGAGVPAGRPEDDSGAPAAAVVGGGEDALSARTAPRASATPSTPATIGPAKVAPRRRWLARVWPAIALGRNGPLPAALARLADGRPLAISDAVRLLVLGIDRAGGAASAEAAPAPAAHHLAPSSPFAPGSALAPNDREFVLFVSFYFAAVLAALAATLWARLRARYR
ncbi:MAG TPA: hypothetical protein VLK56_01325 [Solirubrobacterales bacterium]|nr:hypothetical protein [Solirubrobacterales bacterium]